MTSLDALLTEACQVEVVHTIGSGGKSERTAEVMSLSCAEWAFSLSRSSRERFARCR